MLKFVTALARTLNNTFDLECVGCSKADAKEPFLIVARRMVHLHRRLHNSNNNDSNNNDNDSNSNNSNRVNALV